MYIHTYIYTHTHTHTVSYKVLQVVINDNTYHKHTFYIKIAWFRGREEMICKNRC